jgi:hypothetical protein
MNPIKKLIDEFVELDSRWVATGAFLIVIFILFLNSISQDRQIGELEHKIDMLNLKLNITEERLEFAWNWVDEHCRCYSSQKQVNLTFTTNENAECEFNTSP